MPVTFALSPEQVLLVNFAEQNATGVRLSLLRAGRRDGADQAAARLPARAEPGAAAVSHRLLLAIADADVASSAAALAQEGEGLEVVAVVDDAEEVARALRRYEVDVVVLHDALGAVPVLDLAREIGQAFPEVGLVLIETEDSPESLRSAMQAGLRDVVSQPLTLDELEGSVRAAAQWSRALRDRVAGEESAAGALGGQLIAVAGSKGGVGTTTVALQLTLAAVRAAPGAARSASSTSICRRATCAATSTCPTGAAWSISSRSRTRSPCATCRRRCTRTRRASGSCSRPTRASAARRSTPAPRARSSRRSRPATR